MSVADEKKVLSVFCLTYNHVNYIKRTIESFLVQNTSFEFDIFIFDDASNDGTSEIIRHYTQMYPKKIKSYISEKNTYRDKNRTEILNQLFDLYLDGKYVAWCEGDDYWIDKNKLQKQVEFLENNPECVMVAHAHKIWDSVNKTWSVKKIKEKNGYLTNEEVILQPQGNLATASLVMKRDVFLMQGGFPRCDVLDFPMQLNAISKGRIYYMSDIMSVYRYMHLGSWTFNYVKNEKMFLSHSLGFIEFLKKYNLYTKRNFEQLIYRKIKLYISDVIEFYYIKHKYIEINAQYKNINLINEMNKVLRWLFGDFDRSVLENVHKIYLYGNGHYSKILQKSILEKGFQIDGFIVSKKIDKNDDNVITVSDVENLEDFFCMIAISQQSEEEIMVNLEQNKITNYIAPLWIKREVILGEE